MPGHGLTYLVVEDEFVAVEHRPPHVFERLGRILPQLHELVGQRDFLRGGLARPFTRRLTLSPTPLERAESLEQLRALEHGYRIRVAATRWLYAGVSVDTPDDIEVVRTILARATNR